MKTRRGRTTSPPGSLSQEDVRVRKVGGGLFLAKKLMFFLKSASRLVPGVRGQGGRYSQVAMVRRPHSSFDMWLRKDRYKMDQNGIVMFPGISEHAGPKGQKRFTPGGPLASCNINQHFCLKQPSIY